MQFSSGLLDCSVAVCKVAVCSLAVCSVAVSYICFDTVYGDVMSVCPELFAKRIVASMLLQEELKGVY